MNMIEKPLTEKQLKILKYIKKFTRENGYQPTRDMIGANYDPKKPITGVAITHQIKLIEKKQFIKRMGRCSVKFLKKIH